MLTLAILSDTARNEACAACRPVVAVLSATPRDMDQASARQGLSHDPAISAGIEINVPLRIRKTFNDFNIGPRWTEWVQFEERKTGASPRRAPSLVHVRSFHSPRTIRSAGGVGAGRAAGNAPAKRPWLGKMLRKAPRDLLQEDPYYRFFSIRCETGADVARPFSNEPGAARAFLTSPPSLQTS